MDDGAQVVIPDLEEESILLPNLEWQASRLLQSPMSAGGQSGAALVAPDAQPLSPSREATPPKGRAGPRLRHFRSGSLTMDDAKSFRFGSSFSHTLEHAASPSRSERSDGLSTFSFPVKKPSFASLKAVIRGQPATPSTKDPDVSSPSISERTGRSGMLGDIASVSAGLAHATGMPRTRKHSTSGSQASLSTATDSIPPSTSPGRLLPFRHAHQGSHLSEPSIDGPLTSPSSAGAWMDGLSSPLMLLPAEQAPDVLTLDPPRRRSPSARPMTYAMQQVLTQFQTLAEDAIQAVLTVTHDADAVQILFPTAVHRAAWDDVVETLAHLAQHDRELLIDAVLAWRADVLDQPLPSTSLRRQASDTASLLSHSSPTSSTAPHPSELLRRRRALAVTFLVCQALLRAVPPGTNAHMGEDLDDPAMDEFVTTLFHFLHLCSVDRESERGTQVLLHTSLQQQCFDSVARVLGELSRHCLPAIGEQFVSILRHSNAVAASRDNELLTEAAILGMRYLRITLYPMEAFEAGAEFLAVLAKFFAHSHGYRIKRAFARVLHTMLEPVARTASVELHHPVWAAAMNTLLPRAQSLAARSRYWGVAYPLWAMILCASPPDVLVDKWMVCIEHGLARWKERPKAGGMRAIVLECAAQLVWAYLFRCHEGTNPTARRLDAVMSQCLPSPRTALTPQDPSLDACVAILSAGLYRQWEYTRPVVLDLLRHTHFERTVPLFQPDTLQPTRMVIAVRAVACTLHAYASGEPVPFPSGSRPWPEALAMEAGTVGFPSADIAAGYAQFYTLLAQIALACDYLAKDLSVLDERTPLARGTNAPMVQGERATLDPEHWDVRSHAQGAFTVAYAHEHQPQLELLRTCIDTWPRCLAPSLGTPTCLALLFRALFSVEPALHRASAAALARLARGPEGAAPVLRALLPWLFRQDGLVWELQAHADVLLSKVAQAAGLFVDLLGVWRTQDDPAVLETLAEAEAGALLLLCIPSVALRQHAVAALRVCQGVAQAHGAPVPASVQLLDTNAAAFIDLDHPRLTGTQRLRVQQWGDAPYTLTCLAVANEHTALWVHALARFAHRVAQQAPAVAQRLYTHLSGAIARLEPSMALVAHVRKSTAQVPPTLSLLRAAWCSYTLAWCAVGLEHTQHVTMLVPYLVCADADLQDTAAEALGHVQASALPTLVQALVGLVPPPDMASSSVMAQKLAMARVLAQAAPLLHKAPLALQLLPWLHRTLTFLQSDMLPTLALLQLRRYVCETVRHLYASLPPAQAAQYVPLDMRLRLLALLHDWATLQDGTRMAPLLTAIVERPGADMPRDQVLLALRHEVQALVHTAEQCLMALCAGPLDTSAWLPAPTLLGWVCEMLVAPQAESRTCARGALYALLSHNRQLESLRTALLAQCYRELAQPDATRTVFVVLADMYTTQAFPLLAHEVVSVALTMLAHTAVDVRLAALHMLEALGRRHVPHASLAHVAPAVRSQQPVAYLEVQRTLCHDLDLPGDEACASESSPRQDVDTAGEVQPSEPGAPRAQLAEQVLAELATRVQAHVPPAHRGAVLGLLPPWLSHLRLSTSSSASLAHLISLTLLCRDAHPLATRALWHSVELSLSTAEIHHLLAFFQARALYYRSADFLDVARVAVASAPAPAMLVMQKYLYAALSPDTMVVAAPTPLAPLALEAHLPPPGSELPPIAPALPLLLMLGECIDALALQREHLPCLLHTVCMHVDGAPPLVAPALLRMAEQVLSVLHTTSVQCHPASVHTLQEAFAMTRADCAQTNAELVPLKVQALVTMLATLAEAHGGVAMREAWRDVALHWATTGAVRRLACRSLQVLRALHAPYSAAMLPPLLARLADTLGSQEAVPFVLEALATLQSVLPLAPRDAWAPMFWTAYACASTASDAVFTATLLLLEAWLSHVDLAPDVLAQLLDARPKDWDPVTPPLQHLLLRGLHRSQHDTVTLRVLARLVDVHNDALVEAPAEDRMLTLLTAILPWAMRVCEHNNSVDMRLLERISEGLAAMAHAVERADVERVAQSMARQRFRRADELARQAAACLVVGRSSKRAMHYVSVLLLMLYHDTEWVCEQVLLLLVSLLQACHAQGLAALAPTVSLNPLFRLLRTPLAPLALDVLQAPPLVQQDARAWDEASSYTNAPAQADTERAQRHMRAVATAWATRSPEQGVPFVRDDSEERASQAELDALATQLDDLASFFVQDSEDPPSPQPSSEHVAKILARSTYRSRDSMLPVAAPLPDMTSSEASYDTTAGDGPRFFSSMDGSGTSLISSSDPFVVGRLAPRAQLPSEARRHS
ncbi:Cell morphogenesis protein PAG1 [Malassezia equina]|uniref:Cell morphogenesis protein PAG1 n=1 Tax=Malassezia equina TaxID=1381935 RepID=A0AAF0EAW3_9BASI|nr:Cell morphogenesis protein PAG1 [Malassezia equina]